MPYITQERRNEIAGNYDTPKNPGELDYLLTLTIIDYLNEHGLRYQTINDIVGALEGTKLEFYRRVAVPYEQEKISENGDVYD